jgi:hypothetical protein
MYQNRLTRIPRSVDAIICSSVWVGPLVSMIVLTGPGVGSVFFCFAQDRL